MPDGTDVDVMMSRRRWREVHKPPIRHGDPIFELAEALLPGVSIIMLFASTGIAKRGPIPREPSAFTVIICASAIVLLLLMLSIRLLVKRGISPFSVVGSIVLACVSIASPLVLWVRYEGTFVPLVTAACVANVLCLIAGGLAVFVGHRNVARDAENEISERERDDAAPETTSR